MCIRDSKRKLSEKEATLCLKELKSIESSFIESMYQARKRYLDYVHKKELRALKDTKKKALEELDKS